MNKVLTLLILTFIVVIFADPLAEITWSHTSKDFYFYIKAGTLFGMEAILVFETPLFPVDPLIVFTGCDVNLIKAMMREESGFKVHAKSGTGALGVSQIVRRTAKWLGLKNPYNPVLSAFAMCKYVKHLYKKFPETEKMLWAYHDGEGNVSRKGPSETAKRYASRVLKYYEEYRKTGKLEFFKDRWYLFVKAEYFTGENFVAEFGGAVSILGSWDIEGGYFLESDFERGWFVRNYLRIFHDLAFIIGWRNGSWEVGSSTWLDDYNLEVLATPNGPEAKVYLNGFGFMFKRGRIGGFYRFGF